MAGFQADIISFRKSFTEFTYAVQDDDKDRAGDAVDQIEALVLWSRQNDG